MEYTFSVEEATQKLYTRLSEATGWKYLKSQERCTSNGEAWPGMTFLPRKNFSLPLMS